MDPTKYEHSRTAECNGAFRFRSVRYDRFPRKARPIPRYSSGAQFLEAWFGNAGKARGREGVDREPRQPGNPWEKTDASRQLCWATSDREHRRSPSSTEAKWMSASTTGYGPSYPQVSNDQQTAKIPNLLQIPEYEDGTRCGIERRAKETALVLITRT